MPWCDTCDRFLSPSTVKADGTCPSCGRVDRTPADADLRHRTDGGEPDQHLRRIDDEQPPMPWHLKLLAAALAVYLGYRCLQGIEWVFGG